MEPGRPLDARADPAAGPYADQRAHGPPAGWPARDAQAESHPHSLHAEPHAGPYVDGPLAGAPRRWHFDPARARERAIGALLGAAIGDAVGLQVEGDDAARVAERCPDGVDLPYRGSYKGYEPCDWTDATDSAVLVMRTLGAYFAGKTDNPGRDFAARLAQWRKSGFPELGDTGGLTPESVVQRALAQPGFTADPFAAARAVRGPKADNGALLRTIACAFTASPAEWAVLFCETTHADERCVASAVALALLLRALAALPGGALVPPALIAVPAAAGREALSEPPVNPGAPFYSRRRDYMARLTDTKSLPALALDDRDARSYTLKTLACAMWAFRQLVRTPAARRDAAFFVSTVRQVVAQGGDTSANAMVVGAVLGAALGPSNLPAAWVEALPHGEWLCKEITDFLKAAEPTWELC